MSSQSLSGLKRGHAMVSDALSPVHLLAAGARTGVFATRSISRVMRPDHVRRPDIPTRTPTMSVLASVFAEELMLELAAAMGGHSAHPVDFAAVSRETDQALSLFADNGWLDDPASFHQAPDSPRTVRVDSAQHRKIDYEMLAFDSGYQPMAGMPGTDRWLRPAANRTCYARVLEHPDRTPRPWLVFLHGAQMGGPSDLTFSSAKHYHDTLGFNVLIPVLPMHGPRRTAGTRGQSLISLNWVSNVHALTQVVWDVRRCLAWIRGRGAISIAVHGMSLGGYTTALLAALDPDLDCVIAGLPAATLYRPLTAAATRSPEIHRELTRHGLLGDCVEAVHRVITPTAMDCQVPRGRRFIYAGLADRISTPREPYLLWQHWERPTIFWSPNTHLLTARTPSVRRFVRDAVLSCAPPPGEHPPATRTSPLMAAAR